MIGRFGLGLFGARAESASMRVLAVVASLGLLSACADANMGSVLTPTPAPAPAEQSATATTAAPAAAAGPPSRAAPPAQSATTQQSLTPEQINAECWMIVESNKKVRDIDQRLKLVDKCVAERAKGR